MGDRRHRRCVIPVMVPARPAADDDVVPNTSGGVTMRKPDPKIARLAGVSLFRSCSRRDLERLGRITDHLSLEPGTVLTDQGRVGRQCYVLIDGGADVFVGGARVATVGAGSSVGEMSLLDHRPQSATVVTTAPTQAYVIDSRAFNGILEDVPTLARALLRELSGRVRDLDLARTSASA